MSDSTSDRPYLSTGPKFDGAFASSVGGALGFTCTEVIPNVSPLLGMFVFTGVGTSLDQGTRFIIHGIQFSDEAR